MLPWRSIAGSIKMQGRENAMKRKKLADFMFFLFSDLSCTHAQGEGGLKGVGGVAIIPGA